MRGKLLILIFSLLGLRITPAHAGKTQAFLADCSETQDHPRACGENGATKNQMGWLGGSPPRMRGKLHIFAARRNRHRITPAHAGKTNLKSVLSVVG